MLTQDGSRARRSRAEESWEAALSREKEVLGPRGSESGRKCSHIWFLASTQKPPGSKGEWRGWRGKSRAALVLGQAALKVCFPGKYVVAIHESCRVTDAAHLLMGEIGEALCVCVCTHVYMCLHVTAGHVSVSTPVCASIYYWLYVCVFSVYVCCLNT